MNRRIFISGRKFLRHCYKHTQVEMAKCIARDSPEDRVTLNFDYELLEKRSQSFCFRRMKSEKIQTLIDRMKSKIAAAAVKKKKKKRDESECEEEDKNNICIQFEVNGTKLDVNEHCLEEVCVSGAVMYVGDRKYEIVLNPPTVVSLKLPKQIMQGFTVYPRFEVEFADPKQCEWTWYRIDSTNSKNRTILGTGFMYTPVIEDVGKVLSVSCVPKLGDQIGEELTIQSSDTVQAGPGHCPFELRHLFTTEFSLHGCFRAVTYNILGDCYADTTFTKTQLYPYCASYALSLGYRMQLILKEIIGYKADMICLQEVDWKVFKQHLLPILSTYGFDGAYKEKYGNMREGEALFFRTSKFRYIEEYNINLTESLKSDPRFTDILEKLSTDEEVMTELDRRVNVLQVVLLESIENPRKKLVVGNTHLFFHRDFDYIRVIQGVICVRHLQLVLQSLTEQEERVSLMFCGDFNANPESALQEFMTSGKITPDHRHMAVKDKLEGTSFHHNLTLRNACGEPRYTNFVGGFQSTLDYMFIDHTLDVMSVVPMPSHEEVTQYVALPSLVFPSDHIAQICDITWK